MAVPSGPLVLRVVEGPDAGAQAPVDGRLPIGRAGGGLTLSDHRVSRFHAVVDTSTDDGKPEGAIAVTIADAGSSGGTLLDGRDVDAPAPFVPGSVARVGDSSLVLLEGRRYSLETGLRLELTGPDGRTAPVFVPPDGSVVVGRRGDVVIDDPAISRRHLELRAVDGDIVAHDLGSRNGISLHGQRLDQPSALRAGDELLLRGSGWMLRASAPAEPLAATIELLVRSERTPSRSSQRARPRAARVRAEAAARVGDVARAIAGWLGLDGADDFAGEVAGAAGTEGTAWTLYRAADGVLLHPDDAWAATPVERGETWTVARVAFPGDPEPLPAPERASSVVDVVPRLAAHPLAQRFSVPRPPEQATLRGKGLLWQLGGGLLGVAGGVTLGAVTGNWLFAVLGSFAGLGTMGFGMLAEHSRRRAQVAQFRERLASLEQSIGAALDDEAAWIAAQAPDPEQWEALLAQRDPLLWCRRPEDEDFLALTLGTGIRVSSIEIDHTPGAETGLLADEARAATAARRLPAGPVPTPTTGVFGMAGPARAVDALAMRLLLEAALAHAPSVLQVAVVATDRVWEWARWLPHLDSGPSGVLLSQDPGGAVRLIEQLRAGATSAVHHGTDAGTSATRAAPSVRRLVLVARGAASIAARLLAEWGEHDGLLIVLADDERALPLEAKARAMVSGADPSSSTLTVLGDYAAVPIGAVDVQGIDRDTAERLAMRIGRLRDPRAPDSRRTAAVTLLDLAGLRDHGHLDLQAARRSRRPHDLAVEIGIGDDGVPVAVDLERDGPHGVIAGTTGSGKSEVLASLLAALVGTHRPSELALFLIDFKGGATFARFAGLPHSAGVVTDLEGDEALARRAFTALEAELRRRKTLLSRTGVADLRAYRAAGAPHGAVPSLLVVIDEFALLVQQQPAVKARLDTVASQGRSLGVHLLLATQSPGGVITPAIRANTNLWLCLRVVSEAESRELLGTAEAAMLPVDRPGRVLVRRGAEARTVAFQSARVTVPYSDTVSTVTVEPFADDAPFSNDSPAAETSARTQLAALIDAASVASEDDGEPPVTPLWLPPLPNLLSLDALPAADDPTDVHAPVAVIGLVDLVAAQQQRPHSVDLATSNLMITGAPGRGRSTALLTVAASLARVTPPTRLHIYGLTSERSLTPLEMLPHTAAVVGVGDQERIDRLLARLNRMIEVRRSEAAEPGEERPAVLLLVDDYSQIREVLGDGDASRLEQLHRIITSGRPLGIHVAVTAVQPTDLRLSVSGAFGNRLLLSAVDRGDYLAIDWRPPNDELPPDVPGRAMAAGPAEVQIAHVDEGMLTDIADRWTGQSRPRPIERMPRNIRHAELASTWPGLAVIGVGGPELEPVVADTRAGAHLVVLGEQGSGRSTALATLIAAESAAGGGSFMIASARPGPLDPVASHRGCAAFARSRPELAEMLDRLDEHGTRHPRLLVIDDADELVGELGDRLERLMRAARDTGLRVVVSARAADWVRSFDPWVRYLTSLRSVLMLTNHTELAPMFDVRLPYGPSAPAPAPGRGYLVAAGNATHVQVAAAEPAELRGEPSPQSASDGSDPMR
ncbi:FtsK/SpoIIIE domain-containing protein [Agromyces sp. NPDC049794]|uniref:FtsK/SpoIIIE domain-containing protein n=1 Tax=unclassified Agromyces TaxID=2639701 RepID=UPI0034063BD6